MMRRTYKSKKHTVGGLDHRDMLLTVDDKSSAFDAFYIQNIKQTKREMSSNASSNHHGVASSRVRKRKYVKRVVKEVEAALHESLSVSVFLTPDKSIRVNKPLDPFDQLLNSSPVWPEAKQADKDDPFDRLLVAEKETKAKAKCYAKKKTRLVKKFNHSSSSETDKENCAVANVPQNTTDIKSHQLNIEKEATPSPTIDDSINMFVKNLSLLNNLKSKHSIGRVKPNRSRLARNISSPTCLLSPVSSTPINDKQRSKSIYKFSPIPMEKLDSPNSGTINEDVEPIEQNKSIIFVPKNITNPAKNKSQSPIQNIEKSVAQKSSKSLFSSQEMESLHPVKASSIQNEMENLHEEYTSKQSLIKSNDVKTEYHETTSIQTSELEPLVGFCNDIANVEANNSIIIPLSFAKHSKSNSQKSINASNDNSVAQSSLKSICMEENNYEVRHLLKEQNTTIINVDLGQDINTSNDCIKESDVYMVQKINTETGVALIQQDNAANEVDLVDEKAKKDFDCQIDSQKIGPVDDTAHITLDLTEPSIPFLGFEVCHDIDDNDDPVTDNSLHESNSQKNYSNDSSNSIITDGSPLKSNDESGNPLNTDTDDDEFLTLHDVDKESLYDTCDSDQSFTIDNTEYVVPKVVLERLDPAIFKKYYNEISINNLETKVIERFNASFCDDSIDSVKESKEIANKSVDEGIDKSTEDSYASFDDDEVSEKSKNFDNNETKNGDFKSGNYNEFDDDFGEDIVNDNDPSNDTSFDIDTTVNNHEERCYITTRRKNDLPKNISILVLDDTNASVSSADCDKTVLSIKCNLLYEVNQDVAIGLNKTDNITNTADEIEEKVVLNNVVTNTSQNETYLKEINTDNDNGATKSVVSCRNSSRLTRITENQSLDTTVDTEIKPAIVLQPGKKWERCLSIYRRMTMATENCDQSILEEDLHLKGRKYRESVISLMEMQDCKGTLHNDSIQSRRSTFICKPSRSTIRIVKDTSCSRISLSSTSTDLDELRGFFEECDDTIAELSKLSLEDHEVTVLEKVNEPSRVDDQSRVVASAREYVLRRCNQSEPVLFDECYPDTALKNCRKIGEGVYGEVFLWRAPDGLARVMKVVPIAGSVRVNGECQKHFHEIIAEIVIAMELSALRAPIAEIECHFDEGKHADQLDLHAVENATDVFNEVLAVRCVFGSYPSRLLDLWELYDECKGSENDNPAVLPRDQQYIVLELANAGQDLESYQFNSAEQAYALFLQVSFALAVGEEAFQFEHRDLHWGNVLIAPTEQKYATFILRGRSHRVLRRGVAATIIDYSLSRVSLPVGGAPCALYNDLAADESLFEAVGDYQFDVYRLMRDKLGNEWKNFEPYTNILWLHYMVDKMITSLRYKRPATKVHKQYITKLKSLKNRVLNYGSAVQFVLTDQEF